MICATMKAHCLLLVALLFFIQRHQTHETPLGNIFIENFRRLNGMRLHTADCISSSDKSVFSCHKIGFFISSFNKTAALMQGGIEVHKLPRDGSTCCKPSNPSMDRILPPHVYPLSVVSIDCHIVNGSETSSLTCERSGDTLVTGFIESFLARGNRYMNIPSSGLVCCTPVLLLSTGDAWELKRCYCELPHNKNSFTCQKDKLLLGFDNAVEYDTHILPVAPLKCCNLCIGNSFFDMQKCSQYQHCHNNGVCVMGECKCFSDWIGDDCGTLKSESDSNIPPKTSIWWLGGLGFACAFLCLVLTCWIIRQSEARGASGQNQRGGILGSLASAEEDNGSVGSIDTESEVEEPLQEENGEGVEPLLPPVEGKTKTNEELSQCPLTTTCCICETRPLQVILVPCGHSNLCRKCSRKLQQCPFCRKAIIRRQRLYLSV